MRTITSLLTLSLLSLGACGSSSAATQPAGDTADTSSSGEDVAADPGTDTRDAPTGASESCYVREVNGESGCWDDADAACEAAGCDGECRCTEATAHNTCRC